MIQFVTLCSGSYWKGFAALVQSIHDNSELALESYQFLVLTNDPLETCPQTWAQNRAETIEIRHSANLDQIVSKAPQKQAHLNDALKKLALIGQSNGDSQMTHILIDCDMICLNSLKGIENIPPFAAAPDSLDTRFDHEQITHYQGDINTGFFTYTPDPKLSQELIQRYNRSPEDYCDTADQQVINTWNETARRIQPISTDWNTMKTIYVHASPTEKAQLNASVKILHFIIQKPWSPVTEIGKWKNQKVYYPLERQWWQHFQRSNFENTSRLQAWLYPTRRLLYAFRKAKKNRFKTKSQRALRKIRQKLPI